MKEEERIEGTNKERLCKLNSIYLQYLYIIRLFLDSNVLSLFQQTKNILYIFISFSLVEGTHVSSCPVLYALATATATATTLYRVVIVIVAVMSYY